MSGALGPMSGPQGPPGVAASGAIPNGFVHVAGGTVINPTTFADIAGATCTVTIGAAARIVVTVDATWSAGGSVVCEFRILIGSFEGDATVVDSGGASETNTVPITLRSDVLVAGAYVCKLQGRKVSGSGDATADHVDIFAMALAVE